MNKNSTISKNLSEYKITCSQNAANLLRENLCNLDHEQVWIAYLDGTSTPIKKLMIGMGTFTSVPINHRRVIKEAILCNAAGIILYHNHPVSGDPSPSDNDVKETEKLLKACEIFELQLIDHIIFGSKSYFSFSENQALKFR